MDYGPLVSEEIDAGAELIRRFDKYMPVQAAFWLKAADENFWYLYIASDRIDDTNFDLGYGEVLRIAGEMKTPYLDPFRVKLIPADNPLARAATDLHKRFPGNTPIRFREQTFGGMPATEVYVYPAKVEALVK